MVDTIISLHYYNVFLVLTAAVVTGAWGLFLYFRKLTVNRPWRVALGATALLGALQGLLGIILYLSGLKPGTGSGLYYLHYVYGAIVVLAIPVGLTYTTSGKNLRRDLLIYSIAALVLAAAGARAWMTGPR
ncbi:MAG: hypothetical protein JO202_01030 [Ktedonobacteraceae bacterium]|nr:hypothetical protein [Ktedonobacteraceae bacterium]